MRRFSFVLLALVFALPASAKPQRRTVLDYFKMLPSKFFEAPEKQLPRMKQLRDGFNPKLTEVRSIVDLRNDFLRFPGDGAQPTFDIAVFRFRGQDTVAVFDNFENGQLSFWRARNGRLREVTKSVFPFRLPESSVELPRRGTTIQVFRGNGYDVPKTRALVARFLWRGGRFVRG